MYWLHVGFTMYCTGCKVAKVEQSGEGSSKKEAKQIAAQKIVERLEKEDVDILDAVFFHLYSQHSPL